ncbi:hypothetical protein [Kribbella sindirgiensis]|uniref:Uncharacterized protein n=1 Tax=Kribbella sindirgiensis TaxID=1124744 RepID=A0A4R0IL56_9ACTN|nr:hypothetical protein [Kribbella sindirgiensis]TCC33549.1 hypothetical protein E0H50_16415 [Kribbella sindirgiensis]
MIGPPERVAGEQIALLRSVGYAAFGRHERDLDVLDLVFDSLVDQPGADDVRRLRFAGHGVTLDVERTTLTVELRVSPAGPVVVEARGGEGPGDAQLVSFLLRWPGSEQRPVRTAWIML